MKRLRRGDPVGPCEDDRPAVAVHEQRTGKRAILRRAEAPVVPSVRDEDPKWSTSSAPGRRTTRSTEGFQKSCSSASVRTPSGVRTSVTPAETGTVDPRTARRAATPRACEAVLQVERGRDRSRQRLPPRPSAPRRATTGVAEAGRARQDDRRQQAEDAAAQRRPQSDPEPGRRTAPRSRPKREQERRLRLSLAAVRPASGTCEEASDQQRGNERRHVRRTASRGRVETECRSPRAEGA